MKKNLILNKAELMEWINDNISRLDDIFTAGTIYTEDDVKEMDFWQDLLKTVDAWDGKDDTVRQVAEDFIVIKKEEEIK